MSIQTQSLTAILVSARRGLTDAAELDRRDASEKRNRMFDRSIQNKIAASQARGAQAENDFHIANVEAGSKLVPVVGDIAARAITVGAEYRYDAASVVGLGEPERGAERAVKGIAGDSLVGETLEKADSEAAITHAAVARDADVAAEIAGKASSDAEDAMRDARDRRAQVYSDARSLNQELRDARRAALEI